jgi:hypothetical protein
MLQASGARELEGAEGEGDVVVVDEPEGAADSGAAVDALFARLRASHTADPEPPAALQEAEPTEAGAEAEGEEAPAAPDDAPEADSSPADAAGPTAEAPVPEGSESPPEKEDTPAPPAATEAGEEALTDDDALRAARDEVVGPVTHDLGRRAKRALQDQQNELLDKIRTAKGKVESGKVLPDQEEMRSAWVTVLHDPLTTAYAEAQVSIAGPDRKSSEIPTEVLDELAREMVDPWRDRLVTAIDGAGDDADAMTQRIGARYREYRGRELENRLADAVATAWARGTFDAAPEGARLRWVPAQIGRCPDCDDNALEPTARTEPFPTGQLHPPAHPGCHCFLALAT